MTLIILIIDKLHILLYLCICIALLVGWTVQKRCQCARPHEKKVGFEKGKGRRKTAWK